MMTYIIEAVINWIWIDLIEKLYHKNKVLFWIFIAISLSALIYLLFILVSKST